MHQVGSDVVMPVQPNPSSSAMSACPPLGAADFC
jgi:hypothetical protein